MKHMKKSMFITTLLMVVLLIVAVSTSTFAWFAANDTVVATQTTMTAATSSDANITIGWEPEAGMGQSIDFANGEDMQPMIPELMPLLTTDNIPEQYVATNADNYTTENLINTTGDYEFVDAPYVNVVDVDMSLTILSSALGETNDYNVEASDVGLLKRLYRTQQEDVQHFLMTTLTITEGTEQIDFDETLHDFLEITATPVNPNQLTIAEFQALHASDYSGVEVRNTAGDVIGPENVLNGRRIYLIEALEDIYEIFDIGEQPSSFMEDGVTYEETTSDFLTIIDESGVFPFAVESDWYINQVDVQDVFGLEVSEAGDKIYMARDAMNAVGRTNYSDFQTSFNSGTIDNLDRFRSDIGGTSPITLSNAEESTFYIRNNNAAGSPPARITVTLREGITTGPLAQYLRLSLFYHTGANYMYAGTLSTAELPTHYGDLVEGAHAQEFLSYTSNGRVLNDFVTIDPNQYTGIRIVAWYDGLGLDSDLSGVSTDFILDFSAVNVQE